MIKWFKRLVSKKSNSVEAPKLHQYTIVAKDVVLYPTAVDVTIHLVTGQVFTTTVVGKNIYRDTRYVDLRTGHYKGYNFSPLTDEEKLNFKLVDVLPPQFYHHDVPPLLEHGPTIQLGDEPRTDINIAQVTHINYSPPYELKDKPVTVSYDDIVKL